MRENSLWKVDANIWDGLAVRFVYGQCKTQAYRELFPLELERSEISSNGVLQAFKREDYPCNTLKFGFQKK